MTDPSWPSPADIDAFLGEVTDADAAHVGGPRRSGLISALSLRRGSIVMIALPNSVELLDCFFAVLQGGCVPALIAPSTPWARVKRTAHELGATALIRASGRPAQLADRGVVCLGSLDLVEFAEHAPAYHEPGHVIMLTSGTSGTATGCLHDFGALLRNARRHAESIGLRDGDRMLVNLPMHYSFALVAQVLAGFLAGARLVLAGPPFSAARYAKTLAECQITVSSLTPRLVTGVLKAGAGLPGRLRVLTVGGAPLPAEHTRKLLRGSLATELYLTYGLTEAGPRVTTLAAHEQAPERHDSVGRALPGVSLGLRDAGRGDREREVVVRSDTLCVRRIGLPGLDSANGALPTGDLGFIDDDGYLFLRGRLSDFVIIRGEKVNLGLVRRLAESVDGVVKAVPTAGQADDGTAPLELDLYVDDEAMLGETALRRRLCALLTPSERPGTIRVHRAPSELPHK